MLRASEMSDVVDVKEALSKDLMSRVVPPQTGTRSCKLPQAEQQTMRRWKAREQEGRRQIKGEAGMITGRNVCRG
jgi:hypothetical protein